MFYLGLLFSIEVTATYYAVRNYFLSAWAAACSGLTFRILWNIFFGEASIFGAITETNLHSQFSNYDALLLIILSILMAIIGSIIGISFIFVTITIIHIRRKFAIKSPSVNSYVYSIVVIVITSILLFPELTGYYMTLPLRFALQDLLSGSLENSYYGEDWNSCTVYVSLLLYGFSRYYLCAMSISMPIPCGLFFPCLVSGVAIGRFIGECLKNISYFSLFQDENFPAIVALLGGAATIAVITQTFSSAVIMAELSGQLLLFIPLTVSKE